VPPETDDERRPVGGCCRPASSGVNCCSARCFSRSGRLAGLAAGLAASLTAGSAASWGTSAERCERRFVLRTVVWRPFVGTKLAKCALTAHLALHSADCAPHSKHCTLHTAHCTLHTIAHNRYASRVALILCARFSRRRSQSLARRQSARRTRFLHSTAALSHASCPPFCPPGKLAFQLACQPAGRLAQRTKRAANDTRDAQGDRLELAGAQETLGDDHSLASSSIHDINDNRTTTTETTSPPTTTTTVRGSISQ